MALCKPCHSRARVSKRGNNPPNKASNNNSKGDYPIFTKDLFTSVFPSTIPEFGRFDKNEADPCEFFSRQIFLGSGRMGQAHLARRREFQRYSCTTVPQLTDDTVVVWVRMDAKVVDYVDAIRLLKPFTIDSLHPSLFLCRLLLCFRSRLPDQDLKYHLICKYETGQTSFCKQLQQAGKLPEVGVKLYAMELANALFFLHSFDVIFRRLCTCCILVKDTGHLLLAPYSSCKQNIDCGQSCNMLASNCGEQFYAAPEVVFGVEAQNTADWWSYGVLLYQMLTSKHPFTGRTLGDLAKAITESDPVIPDHVCPEATALIKHLLHKDHRRRLGTGHTVPQCIERHPFFFGMNWDDVRGFLSDVEPPFKVKLPESIATKSKLAAKCKEKSMK